MTYEDRPPLYRPRLGRVGFVPAGAIDCTVGELAETPYETLERRLKLKRSEALRVAFNVNIFDWRPWGFYTGMSGRVIHVRHPNDSMGIAWALTAADSLHSYRAWLWRLRDEVDEDVYLTRRRRQETTT